MLPLLLSALTRDTCLPAWTVGEGWRGGGLDRPILFVDSFAVCTFHTANLLDSFLTNNQRHLHSPPTASARAAATTRIEIQIETDSKYGRPNNAEYAEVDS